MKDPHLVRLEIAIDGLDHALDRFKHRRSAAMPTELAYLEITLAECKFLAEHPGLPIGSYHNLCAAFYDFRAELVHNNTLSDEAYAQFKACWDSIVASAAAQEACVSPQPSRAAAKLIAAVVRLLPWSCRSRYAEEFHAELIDLPRRQQLGYALSVFRGVFQLRRVVKTASMEKTKN